MGKILYKALLEEKLVSMAWQSRFEGGKFGLRVADFGLQRKLVRCRLDRSQHGPPCSGVSARRENGGL
jgi:hypothetical protein